MIISCQCACNEWKEEDPLPPLIVELASFPYPIDPESDTGVCSKLDRKTNLCTVYYERPRVCNIERMYLDYWCGIMSREDWLSSNKISCEKLQTKIKEWDSLHGSA